MRPSHLSDRTGNAGSFMRSVFFSFILSSILALSLSGCRGDQQGSDMEIPRSDIPVAGIAFVTESGLNRDIYLVQPDGSGRQILIGSEEVDSDPAFSPDGRTLAFRSRREGSSEIYLVAADGTGEWLNLINDPADSFDDEFNPRWHPSGELLAIFTDRFQPPMAGCSGQRGVHHLGFISLTELPFNVDHFDDLAGEQETLSWSADGHTLAIGSICTQNNVQIFFWDRETREVKAITEDHYGSANPVFSPDGKYLAFSSTVDGPTDILIYDLQTSEMRNLTNSPSKDRHPSWSPDSKWIAFTSDESGNDDIFVIALDGDGRRNITNSPGRDILPSWSPAK